MKLECFTNIFGNRIHQTPIEICCKYFRGKFSIIQGLFHSISDKIHLIVIARQVVSAKFSHERGFAEERELFGLADVPGRTRKIELSAKNSLKGHTENCPKF